LIKDFYTALSFTFCTGCVEVGTQF
jgi:hypothetical protein